MVRSHVSKRFPEPRAPSDVCLSHPWWEHLDKHYADQDEDFTLMGFDKIRVQSTAALDVVLRSAAASMVASLALPLGYRPKQFEEDLGDTFYQDYAERRDPSFFEAPVRPILVDMKPAQNPSFKAEDGACVDISYASNYTAANPRIRERARHTKVNATVHARYWYHQGAKARPTIVAIHGFSADFYRLNTWFFALDWFYKKGYDVLLFTLPHHGQRQSKWSPFSGHGYFSHGLSGINEALAQSIHDLRGLIRWLKDVRGAGEVGVTGVSLGGYTASMLASVESDLAFAIPNVPVISLGDLVLEWEPIGALLRALMWKGGHSLADVRRHLAVSCPLTYDPAIDKSRMLIIGGIADRLAPPKQSRLLFEHWGRPRVHWFVGSHVLHLDRRLYFEQIYQFLKDIKF